MEILELKFHILIRKANREYSIMPLLFNGPVVKSDSFRETMATFEKQIHLRVTDHILAKTNLEAFQWMNFFPEIQVSRQRLEFKSKKNLYYKETIVIYFTMNGFKYAVLPLIHYKLILLGKENSLDESSIPFVSIYQKFIRESSETEMEDTEKYFSTSSDSVEIFHSLIALDQVAFPSSSISLNQRYISPHVMNFNGGLELKSIGQNLNQLFPHNLMRTLNRPEKILELEKHMFGENPPCVMIVGSKGSGKTALIHEVLMSKLTSEMKEYKPSEVKLLLELISSTWYIDPERIIAGMNIIGYWERRTESILAYLYSYTRREKILKTINDQKFSHFQNLQELILKPDNLHIRNMVSLFYIGKSQSSNLCLANVMKPYLEKRLFGFIGEATPEEWLRVKELDRSFADLFSVITLDSPIQVELLSILLYHRNQIEKKMNAEISNSALKFLLTFQSRFSINIFPPASIVNVLKQITIRYKKVGIPEIQEAFKNIFHFKEMIIDRKIKLTTETILKYLNARIIGQESAKNTIANVIHNVKSELHDTEKPISSLLFIGPTGVGKTELAKTLSEFLFDSSDYFLRFNMNEYIDANSVSRLIGDFRNPEGSLTTKVRHRKACVVLFDEIEKAHPSIHDLLLQLLGEGRLTNALGNLTEFKYTIIIMTSNLGADQAKSQIGFAETKENNNSSVYKKEIENFFRPEFMNRIDSIVEFTRLGKSEILLIARLQVEKLLLREGLVRRSILLKIHPHCLNEIVEEGFDSNLGARALIRNLEKTISFVIGKKLSSLSVDNPILLYFFIRGKEFEMDVSILEYSEKVPVKIPNIKITSMNLKIINQIQDEIFVIKNQLEEDLETENKKPFLWKIRENINLLYEYFFKMEEELAIHQMQQYLKAIYIKKRIHQKINYVEDPVEWKYDSKSFLKSVFKKISVVSEGDDLKLQYLFANLNFQKYFYQSLQDNLYESFLIRIEVVDEILDSKLEMEFLVAQLKIILNEISEFETLAEDEIHIKIKVNGYGIKKLLHLEEGLHIFFRPNLPTIACYFSILPVENDTLNKTMPSNLLKLKDYYRNNKIIRLYHFNREGLQNIVDIRSGIVFNSNLSEIDWKIMLHSVISDST